MSGFLKMSSFATVTKMLYNFYIIGLGNGKNIKISYSDFIAQFNLDITAAGATPIFYSGFNLPSVNNSGGDLVKGNWVILSPGNYVNIAGGAPIVVPEQNIGISIFNGETWGNVSLIEIPIPAGADVIVENGTLLVTQDAVYKYVQVLKDDLSEVIVKTENLVPVFTPQKSSTVFYEASTFSGWGTYYGVFNNFDFIRFWYKDLTHIGLADVTTVKYRVCENDQNGAVLASGEVLVDFTAGQEGWINIQLPQLIQNSNNSNIWFEFWGNGNMALYSSQTIIPGRLFRYKKTSIPFNNNFAQSSTTTSGEQTRLPTVQFFRNDLLVEVNPDFANEVLESGKASDVVGLTNENAVSGKGVKLALEPFEDIISLQFVEQSSQATAQRNVVTSYSTFAAWGQLMGNRSGFNAVKYRILPYDAANVPTYVTLTIRKGGNLGDILFQKRIDYNFNHNVSVDLIYELGYFFDNTGNDDLFVQYHSDGYIACIGSHTGQTSPLYYLVGENNPVLTSTTTNTAVLYTEFLVGEYKGTFTDEAKEQIEEIAGLVTYDNPDVLLASRVWLMPGLEYGIYNKNIIIPAFGDNLENYRLDYSGAVGVQQTRRYLLNPITASLNNTISLTVYNRNLTVATKSQLLISAAAAAGSGVTRKVLIVGDSTVNGSNISTPLKAVFDADVMDIELLGTLGATGVKHEGRGGWTVNDYYGIGRVLYVVNVTGMTVAPGVGAGYTQGGVTYNVVEVNITGGDGYFSLQSSSSNRPLDLTGTLTKVSGAGDATITYSSSSVTSSNPFYNPATEKFDIGYYLSQTGQSMAANDWIFFQLGINDVFNISSKTDAINKVNVMISQMGEIIANIKAYNPDIRIGLVVTFPPASQDAFGTNYALGQTAERYIKTGLVEWQKKLLSTYDNSASLSEKIYLISAHANIDTEYNYPSVQEAPNARYTGSVTVNKQNNGVHPAASGYAQIADMYAGAIKYFA